MRVSACLLFLVGVLCLTACANTPSSTPPQPLASDPNSLVASSTSLPATPAIWQQVHSPTGGLRFEIPADWPEAPSTAPEAPIGNRMVWTSPSTTQLAIGFQQGSGKTPLTEQDFFPAQATVLDQTPLNLPGQPLLTMYTIEVVASPPDGTAYFERHVSFLPYLPCDFYVRGTTISDLEDLDPILQHTVGSVIR